MELKENPTGFELEQYKQIGNSLYNLKYYDDSLTVLKYYEKYRPNDSSNIRMLGYVYDALNQPQTAIDYYKRALLLYPNDHMLYGNIGRNYSDLDNFGNREQEIYYTERAYSLNPNDKTNIVNCFLVYCKFGMTDKVKEFEQKVLSIAHTPDILFSYGCYLIHQRNFIDGFRYYRYRIEYDVNTLPSGLHDMWQPDTDFSDKTVLVTYEQGFGDTFQFIRFANDLKCKKVWILVQDEVYSLLKYTYNNVCTEHNLPEYDCFVPMMDLPIIIGLTPETITQKEGYLKLPDERIKQTPIVSDKLKIGISFEGSPMGAKTCREIPLEKLYPLMELPNVKVYSLQVSDIHGQLDKVPEKYNLIKLGQTFDDWEDTAVAIKQMDLIVTTDNGIMNLAGALGVKTFGLFNKYPEFRWFTMGDDVGWYTIKPFQCREYNKWEEPVAEVIKQIKSFS